MSGEPRCRQERPSTDLQLEDERLEALLRRVVVDEVADVLRDLRQELSGGPGSLKAHLEAFVHAQCHARRRSWSLGDRPRIIAQDGKSPSELKPVVPKATAAPPRLEGIAKQVPGEITRQTSSEYLTLDDERHRQNSHGSSNKYLSQVFTPQITPSYEAERATVTSSDQGETSSAQLPLSPEDNIPSKPTNNADLQGIIMPIVSASVGVDISPGCKSQSSKRKVLPPISGQMTKNSEQQGGASPCSPSSRKQGDVSPSNRKRTKRNAERSTDSEKGLARFWSNGSNDSDVARAEFHASKYGSNGSNVSENHSGSEDIPEKMTKKNSSKTPPESPSREASGFWSGIAIPAIVGCVDSPKNYERGSSNEFSQQDCSEWSNVSPDRTVNGCGDVPLTIKKRSSEASSASNRGSKTGFASARRRSIGSALGMGRGGMDVYKIDTILSNQIFGSDLLSESSGADFLSAGNAEIKDQIDEASESVGSSESFNQQQVSSIQTRPRTLVRMGTLQSLRQREMTQKITESLQHSLDLDEDETPSAVTKLWQAPVWFLQFHGILPMRDGVRCWQWMFPMLTIGLLVYYAYVAIHVQRFRFLAMSGLCCPVGSLLGLSLLRHGSPSASGLLIPYRGLLPRYAITHGFDMDWSRSSFQVCFFIWCLWFVATVIWLYVAIAAYENSMGWVALLGPVVGGSLFSAIMCCHMHICCHLELMVDKFCIAFVKDPDFPKAVCQWGVLQTIFRQTTTSISACFLVAQTSVLLVALLIGVEMLFKVDEGEQEYNWLWSASAMPYVLITLFCLIQAAAVTEKCSRVPALVNSVLLEESPLNDQRQYLVQYIHHSAAGFYVNGVRLTAFMVMKLCYLSGMLVFAFAAHILQK